MSKKQKCVICAETISKDAKKCLKCGSMQNWTRYFDFGNTSLSLIIAAISVLALVSDEIESFIDFFRDNERAKFTAKILNLQPEKMTLFLDNNGPGVAVFDGGALCFIRATKNERDLWNNERGFIVRYPRSEEVVGRYIYTFALEDHKPLLIKPGENRTVDLPFWEISSSVDREKINSSKEVKSYCSIAYTHENGESHAKFDLIDPIYISFFAISRPEVIKVMKTKENVFEKELNSIRK